MENISRGPTFGDFVTIRTQSRTSQLQDYRILEYCTLVYRLPFPPSFKCNVLRESLSVDSQNIPCATLQRRGSWVISVYLWPRQKLYWKKPTLIFLSSYLAPRFLLSSPAVCPRPPSTSCTHRK